MMKWMQRRADFGRFRSWISHRLEGVGQPKGTKEARLGRSGIITRSSSAPPLPAPSLSFPDPLHSSGAFGTLRRPARPRPQPAFYQGVVDVNFDGASFNAQLARYFFV
jgi:hypothetical protein